MKTILFIAGRVVLVLMLLVAVLTIYTSATSSNFIITGYNNESDMLEGYVEVKSDVRTKYMYISTPSHYIFTLGSNRTWIKDSDIEDNEEVYVFDVRYDLNEGI